MPESSQRVCKFVLRVLHIRDPERTPAIVVDLQPGTQLHDIEFSLKWDNESAIVSLEAKEDDLRHARCTTA
jgi:hypothetical protein